MRVLPKGVLPAMITPVHGDGSLNGDSLCKMIDYVIEGGVHGVFAMGTTAEFYAVDHGMYKETIQTMTNHTAGRVPVYVGANAITTREAVKLVQIAGDLDVETISVLTPMFISPNDDELFEHYNTIAQSTDKNIVLYNNRPKTGVNLSPVLVEKLAALPNVVGIKDSAGDFTQTSEYIRRTQSMDFSVMMGRDTLIYANLCYGGDGAVAACANIAPKLVSGIYDNYVAGNLEAALDCQRKLAPLRLAFDLGTFPAVIKEALCMIGIDAGQCFKPIGPLSTEDRTKLRGILLDIGLPVV